MSMTDRKKLQDAARKIAAARATQAKAKPTARRKMTAADRATTALFVRKGLL